MFPSAGRSALTGASKPPFRFRGCLYAKRRASVQLSKSAPRNVPVPPSADDAVIISELDRPSTSYASSPLSPTGLFRHNILTTPIQFKLLADATQRRAEILTERIVRARESREELYKVVKNLDRLSDMLCGVIDLAELIRNTHPDRVWVEHAELVYDQLCQFMNVLNTHTGLYEVLSTVLSDPDIVKSLDAEARETALIFWRDFEKSGVNLPPAQREHFVSLSSEILSIGREFMMESSKPRPPAIIKPMELRGLKDGGMGMRIRLQADATQRDMLVYPGSPQAQMIMTSAPEEEPRRKVYMASNSSTEKQVYLLDRMLQARGEIARLVGKESYAAMALSDKMAKCPENVNHFINALLDHTSPYARRALRALSIRKQAHLNTPPFPIIQAWDRDYYCPPEPPAPPVSLPSLTLGTVFMGLSRLFRALYGVTLRLSDVAPGEAWHKDVKKLEVIDEEQGILGWIYADLFARRGKPSGAAHYTVRCSRRTDHDDVHGDLAFAQDQRDRDAIEIAKSFDSVHRSRIPGRQGVFQLPLVVLVCEFSRPSARSGPTTLAWHEVVTLFHEMGHAMHSMIGRTEYQNVSGTRCATDFVELPSILMEHFLNSPTVLSLFDISGKPIRQAANHHEDPCRSIDTHTQILLAALDQIYHSPAVMQDDFNSTTALAKLYETRGLIPYVPGTSWQTQFGHLFGYGATYYSYLFDRAIASRVWRNLFSHDPLNRETGERFKNEILQHGGAKDPWQMVSTLLNEPGMAGGDAEAMAEVGRWKIEDEVPTRH